MHFRTQLVVSNVISFLFTVMAVIMGRKMMTPIEDSNHSQHALSLHDARNLRSRQRQLVNDVYSPEERACCVCLSLDYLDNLGGEDGERSIPSSSPSDVRSALPSISSLPTMAPSEDPSSYPSLLPSGFPSALPSLPPTVSLSPSFQPSVLKVPSSRPSMSPSSLPSASPSSIESFSPSSSTIPSPLPSSTPSLMASLHPSASTYPSTRPSQSPTVIDSLNPSSSISPSESPSQPPSAVESSNPSSSIYPSESPSQPPSAVESSNPSSSIYPSESPSPLPSSAKSSSPSSSVSPSSLPSSMPSVIVSSSPSTSNFPSLHSPSSWPSASPVVELSVSPSLSLAPSGLPSRSPSMQPQPDPIPFTIVLSSGSSMVPNSSVTSPNGLFAFRMGGNNDDPDDLLLLVQLPSPSSATSSEEEVIWKIGGGNASSDPDTTSNGRTRICFMQSGGNMVVRSPTLAALWTSETSQNPGAYLILDDEGQLAVVVDEEVPSDDGVDTIQTNVWMTGRPKGQYQYSSTSLSPANKDLTFPIRGTFYYPWFPETWTVNKQPTIYNATLGKYQTARAATVQAHLDAMAYARIDLAVISWFGPDTHEDRARITNILTSSQPSTKWSIYHEAELGKDPSVEELRDDLNYIKKWFAWHDSWAHIEGKPVIFVYNEPLDCDVSARWMEAAQGEWYVVLKLFRDFEACPVQPDSWHQYGPASAVIHNKGHSFSISPGFWRADHDVARLARLSEEVWRDNVAEMVASNAPWQLITTFNEWGEGTAVESGLEWASDSSYGYYLDALHDTP